MRTRSLTLEAAIGELSPGGDGVAICEIDGERRAVFVGGVATGERVRVEVDPSRRPARGRLLEVLEASSTRTSPVCAHVERCGGCDWMHLTPIAQTNEHAVMVHRLLSREPRDPREATPEPRAHSPARTERYRSRTRVHVEAKRGRVVVGMFARGTHEPAAVDTCIVLDPVLDRARASLASLLVGATGRGEAQLSLGRPGARRRAVLDLRWKGGLPDAFFGRVESAVKDETLAGARVFAGDVAIPAVIGDPTPFLSAADGELLQLAPGGFSQATEEGNILLARRVAELARELPAGPAVELYAGAGNLTVLLARDRELVAVEQGREACVAARENLARRGLSARVVEADAATFAIPASTTLVVLDPPREGARAVAEGLARRAAKNRPPAVLYVSCDPPTLARDVRTMTQSGYVVRSIDTFEMFPHTSHVETVVVLTHERRPR